MTAGARTVPALRPRGAGLAAVGLGALVGALVALAAAPFAALVVAVGAATLLLLVPERALWAAMLVVFALVPLAFLPVPDLLVTVSPPVLLVAVLALRRSVRGPLPRPLRGRQSAAVLLAFGGWLALTVVASPYRGIAVGWFVSFSCLALLPPLLARRDPSVRSVLSRTWILLGALLGAYALVEAFVLQANPLLDALYAGGPRGSLEQRWSLYRATTTLGHPLSNGSFFAIAVPLALGAALHRRSSAAAAAAVLAAGGVVASGTRSALAAMVVGAAVVVLVPGRGQRRTGRTLVATWVVAAAVALALLLGSSYLAARDASGEGAASAAFRSTQVPIAVETVLESPVVGTGPGAASFSQQSLLARVGGAGAFESWWLELAVGAGVPGLLLGAAVLAAAAGVALRSGAPEVCGAVLAWTVSATFVNALEGGRPEHLVLGLVLALAFAGSGAAPQPVPRDVPRRRAPVLAPLAVTS